MFIIGTGKVRPIAAEITEQRLTRGRRRRVRRRERNAEQRIRAEILFVRRAVERDQFLVDLRLLERVPSGNRRRDCFLHGADGLGHAFAAVTFLVAIAQLPRFMLAGAGAARHRRATHRAAFQMHIHFDSGVPARIQNLARVDPGNASRRHTCDELHQIPSRKQSCFP